jgi:chromatin segregation and condensation protein Rec8/ScpA/Scc1 (kleisin family)
MLIKSISLLPNLEISQEESQSIEELESRLKTYQRIRELSRHISDRFGHNIIFPRSPSREQVVVFAPTREVSIGTILESIHHVLKNIPKVEAIPKLVVKKVLSLEEAITNLTTRIQSAIRMRFSDFVHGHKEERVSVIVSFLGMLELVKEGIIAVEQDAHFKEIAMESVKPDIPRY